jgi:hypothetical protein
MIGSLDTEEPIMTDRIKASMPGICMVVELVREAKVWQRTKI